MNFQAILRKSLFPLAVAGTCSSSAAWADQRSDAADYIATGHAILANLETPQPDYPTITAGVNQMLEHAKSVALAFGETYAQCAPQVAKILELYPQIAAWSPIEIRRNIEGGLALPQAEGCYSVRDVVAHPAITRALANRTSPAPQPAQLHSEMAEGVEHMEEIVRALGLE